MTDELMEVTRYLGEAFKLMKCGGESNIVLKTYFGVSQTGLRSSKFGVNEDSKSSL